MPHYALLHRFAARVGQSIPLLDEEALRAVRNWHFAPTRVNGQPVPKVVVSLDVTDLSTPTLYQEVSWSSGDA
ncbi:MAG: hypothetical protein DMF92_10650 [Acidobacteria bacterium]|nr:MAG: hypothetical protein DMF92_10650 [Acidobacteriota bacterium]